MLEILGIIATISLIILMLTGTVYLIYGIKYLIRKLNEYPEE